MKEASVETVVDFLSHNSIETPENALEFADAFNSTHKRLVSAVIGYGALARILNETFRKPRSIVQTIKPPKSAEEFGGFR